MGVLVPQWRGEENFAHCGPPHISRLVQTRNFKFISVLIQGSGPNQNCANVGHMGTGSCDSFKFWDPPLYLKHLKLDT